MVRWLEERFIRGISVYVISFLCLVFGSFGLLLDKQAQIFFTEKSQAILLRDATIIATEIDGFVREKRAVLEMMRTHRDFTQMLQDIRTQSDKRQHPLFSLVTKQLQEIVEFDPDISLAFLGFARANELISSIETFDSEPDYVMRNRAWYQEILAKAPLIPQFTTPYQDMITGGIVATMAVPLWENDEDLGVYGIDVRLDHIGTMMEQYVVGNSGWALLVHSNGDWLYVPEKAQVLNGDAQGISHFLPKDKEQALDSRVVFYPGYMGNLYVGITPLSHADWLVVTVVEEAQVLAPLVTFRRVYWLTLLVAIFLSVLFLSRMAYAVGKPIVLMSQEVEAYSRTNRQMDFPKELFARKDEMGVLVTGLRELSLRISHFLAEIEEKNKSLENEVSQRELAQGHLEMILEVLSKSDEGTFVVDSALRNVYCNEAWKRLVAEDITPTTRSYALRKILQSAEVDLQEIPEFQGEVRVTLSSMEMVLLCKIRRVNYLDNWYYTGSALDLTVNRRQAEEMRQLRFYDPLTKLFNATFFEEQVTEILTDPEIKEELRVLIIINVDEFRLINEAKGFDFGNRALLAIARELQSIAEPTELLARLNSDGFALFRQGFQSVDQVFNYATELNRKINKSYFIQGQRVFLNTSMGIASHPSDGVDFESLMKAAMSALNSAKNDREKSFAFFNKDINSESVFRYEVRNRMRVALQNKEFLLYYQPQVDMSTKTVVGIEALLRWPSPQGMMSPAVFVPIAEESKWILPLGEWVLLEACAMGAELEKRGYAIPVAVNISRAQFKAPYMISLLKKILATTRFSPHLLELEITEGVLMDNEKECEELLAELRGMGVTVAIDDFGTGYSSLSYLKKFAVDKIKIDRSFILDIPEKDDGVIAKAIIELAAILQLHVLAEGVETVQQMDFLLQNECNLAQGFYFSRPLAEEDLLEYLLHQKVLRPSKDALKD